MGAQTVFIGTGAGAGGARAGLAATGESYTNDLTGYFAGPISFGPLGTAILVGGRGNGSGIDATGAGAAVSQSFSFSQLLNGFGADFSQLGTCCANSPYPNGTIQLSFFNGGSLVGVFAQALVYPAGDGFFGVGNLPAFDRVEFNANNGDFYISDNLTAVTTTPEPASLALLATGLVGVVAVRRRRRA